MLRRAPLPNTKNDLPPIDEGDWLRTPLVATPTSSVSDAIFQRPPPGLIPGCPIDRCLPGEKNHSGVPGEYYGRRRGSSSLVGRQSRMGRRRPCRRMAELLLLVISLLNCEPLIVERSFAKSHVVESRNDNIHEVSQFRFQVLPDKTALPLARNLIPASAISAIATRPRRHPQVLRTGAMASRSLREPSEGCAAIEFATHSGVRPHFRFQEPPVISEPLGQRKQRDVNAVFRTALVCRS